MLDRARLGRLQSSPGHVNPCGVSRVMGTAALIFYRSPSENKRRVAHLSSTAKALHPFGKVGVIQALRDLVKSGFRLILA